MTELAWSDLPEFIQRRFRCDNALGYNTNHRCALPQGHAGWHRSEPRMIGDTAWYSVAVNEAVSLGSRRGGGAVGK